MVAIAPRNRAGHDRSPRLDLPLTWGPHLLCPYWEKVKGENARRLPARRFVSHEDGVAGAGAIQAAADAFDFDVEAAVAQTLLEFAIFAGRPDRQHAINFESGEGGGDAAIVIKAGVVRAAERGRAVVHVEQHGVEVAGARTESDGDVVAFDAHAGIIERLAGE